MNQQISVGKVTFYLLIYTGELATLRQAIHSVAASNGERNEDLFGSDYLDLFRLCPPPQLSGCILFAPPDARAIFLHNDLLCNDTCSVTGGSITYWGAQTEKIRLFTSGQNLASRFFVAPYAWLQRSMNRRPREASFGHIRRGDFVQI